MLLIASDCSLLSRRRPASPHGRGVATVVEAVEAAGGCAQLEALQAHQNTTVYERVSKLLETYFSADEPDDPAVVPTAHADSFSFGVPVLGQPTRPFAP